MADLVADSSQLAEEAYPSSGLATTDPTTRLGEDPTGALAVVTGEGINKGEDLLDDSCWQLSAIKKCKTPCSIYQMVVNPV